MTNRSFDDDPTEIKRLMEYHNVEPTRGPNGELGLKIKHNCIHLEWDNGLAKCKIHDTKPIVCKDYSCEKIIKKAIEKAALDGIYL
jgi:Fe-S-cluster containining protein